MSRRLRPTPPPPSPTQALRAFKAALLDPQGGFHMSRHFEERMAERGFGLLDVERLAREGRIFNPPEWDVAHGAWVWRIEGRAVDGRAVYVVFSVNAPKRVTGITIETPGR